MSAMPVASGRGRVRWEPTPDGVAIITQTCDLVLSDRPTAHVARVVNLPTNEAKESRNGRRPNLVPLPAVGPTFFADLTYLATVDKSLVAEYQARPGVQGDEEVRKFGQRVGRRYSRFAFPDDVVPWLRPLQSLVVSKSGKAQSPAGKAFERVASLRIESDSGWIRYPFSLRLCVIVEPGTLPPLLADEVPEISDQLNNWLYGNSGTTIRQPPGNIAERIFKNEAGLDAGARFILWSSLAEAWAGMCKPSSAEVDSVMNAVSGGALEADICSTEEFSYERYRKSEEIDLDHLSSPMPI
ncbi:hypothetical protein ACIO6U_12455 [Streptomyces sp. NPDC087422]|uniref:hypothetical protein n=1 Tax=Streptomyces sp. NPDC087422 TaxID=3365786 RepID=UPI0037F4CFD1